MCVNLVFLRKLWKEMLCFLGGGGGRDGGKLHSCNNFFTTTGRDSRDNSHSAMTPAMAVSLAVQISRAFYLIYQPSPSAHQRYQPSWSIFLCSALPIARTLFNTRSTHNQVWRLQWRSVQQFRSAQPSKWLTIGTSLFRHRSTCPVPKMYPL